MSSSVFRTSSKIQVPVIDLHGFFEVMIDLLQSIIDVVRSEMG